MEADTKALRLERISNKEDRERELGEIHNAEMYLGGREIGIWETGKREECSIMKPMDGSFWMKLYQQWKMLLKF